MDDSTLDHPTAAAPKVKRPPLKRETKQFLVVVGVIVCLAIPNLYIRSQRSPTQVAEEEARNAASVAASMRASEIREKFGDIQGTAETVVRNWILASTGKGICDEVTNTSMGNLRFGSAAYQYGKPEPSITGSFTGTCIYYINGDKQVQTQTYWFQVTVEKKSGKTEGMILLDNPQKIAQGVKSSNFRQEF